MQSILKIPGFTDNVVTQLLSGLGAGFFAVCIGSPVDVVCYSQVSIFFLVAGGDPFVNPLVFEELRVRIEDM